MTSSLRYMFAFTMQKRDTEKYRRSSPAMMP
jgi:hypothetical protein